MRWKHLIVALFWLLLVGFSTMACALDPAVYDLTIYAGETFLLPRRLLAAGRPVDLTGYSYRAQLRTNYTDIVPVAEFSTTPGDHTGVVTLSLSSAQTAPLKLKTGYWDLLLIAPDGSQSYILRGRWKCLATVTR